MTQNDSELISQIHQGDDHAFEQLFNRYEAMLYRFTFYLSGSPELAEEIFQETWLRITRVIAKKKRIKNFKHFLLTIAKNIYRDEIRKRKIRNLVLSENALENKNELMTIRDAEKDYEHLAMDFRDTFEQALQKLTLRQRQVFILVHIEGFKIAQVSEMVGCAQGTVKATVHKAVQKLRHEFQDFYE